MKQSILSIVTALFFCVSYSQNPNSFNNDDEGMSYDSNDLVSNIDIEIPLYNVEIDGTTIPIRLAYNNVGRRVDDLPSSVGFNWELYAGGMINKEIKHLSDDSNNGWFFDNHVEDLSQLTSNPSPIYINTDIASDIYRMFISNGDAVTYFYDRTLSQSQNVESLVPKLMAENKEYAIATNFDNLRNPSSENSNTYLDEYDNDFRIQDNSGINYLFRKGENRIRPWTLRTKSQTYRDSLDVKDYYLHKVHTNFNNESIDFKYETTTLNKIIKFAKVSRVQTNNDPQTPPVPSDPVVTQGYQEDISIEDISRKEIREIKTTRERVEFIYKNHNYISFFNTQGYSVEGVNLQELQNQSIKLLEEINIYDHEDNFIKGYKFEYTEQIENQADFEGLFKLKRILRYAINKKEYYVYKTFNYYSDPYNSLGIDNKEQDVMGFHNGASANAQISNMTPVSISSTEAPPNRMPNESFMINGMLKNIVNKRGGKKEYIYKENSFGDIYYGGLLVKEIKEYDNNDELLRITDFAYDKPEGLGLPVYDDWQIQPGQVPDNLYDKGYFEGHYQGAAAWKTYFTEKNPSMPNNALGTLKDYNISDTPYSLMRNTPSTDVLLQNIGISQGFTQLERGVFYKEITARQLNINTNAQDNGYIITYYRPSIELSTLSKVIERREYYDNSDNKVKELIYNYSLLDYGSWLYYKWENVHTNSGDIPLSQYYNYNIANKALWKLKTVLDSQETIEYFNGNPISNKQEYQYLTYTDNGVSFTNNFKTKEVKSYRNNTLESKTTLRYLSEYQNVPENYQYLYFIDPIIEELDWTLFNQEWRLSVGKVNTYTEDGKVKKVGVRYGNPNTSALYSELDYTTSYFDTNGQFISRAEEEVEYFYNTKGELFKEKNYKTGLNTFYQRSSEYNSLYVDAIMSTNTTNKQFIKKSFENPTEANVVKFNKAFSGNYVFNGNTIDLGNFPNNYIISYWSYGNNRWIYNEYVHQGGDVIITKPTSALYIDEVKIRPKISNINSFTYKPLIGLTSELNDNGQGKRTEYDVFNKPLYLLDKDYNVLQEYRTNYKNNNN